MNPPGQEFVEPEPKRQRIANEDGNKLECTIKSIIRFLSNEENRDYQKIEKELIPSILSKSKTFKEGKALNLAYEDKLEMPELSFYSRIFRDLEYLKINSEAVDKSIILGFISNLPKLKSLSINIKNEDFFNTTGAYLELKRLKIEVSKQSPILMGDPVKQILNCNNNNIDCFTFKNGKLSAQSINKLEICNLKSISLYDVTLENFNVKEKLNNYLKDNRNFEKIKIISKRDRNENPFFRAVALNFLKIFNEPHNNLTSLTITLNQESPIMYNLTRFSNLKKFSFYYCPLLCIENVIRLLDHIKALYKRGIFLNLEIIAVQCYSYPIESLSNMFIMEQSSLFSKVILNINPNIKIVTEKAE